MNSRVSGISGQFTRSNARARRGDYSRAASLTLTAPLVGSASAGFELRHPIATRAVVTYARFEDSTRKTGSRAVRPARKREENFALYFSLTTARALR